MNKSKELKDFQTWHVEEPYENFVGPFYFKIKDDKTIAAFDFKDHHTNSINSLHGGMIMSFADYALFIIGHKYTSKSNYVTCLLYTSPSPRDRLLSRMPSSA